MSSSDEDKKRGKKKEVKEDTVEKEKDVTTVKLPERDWQDFQAWRQRQKGREGELGT